MPRPRKAILNHDPARRSVGIWIDHRQAVLVFVAGQEKELVRIRSNVERHPGRARVPSSHRRFDPHRGMADDVRERRFTGQLARFYAEVIARIAGTEEVFIFGPGEAKGELRSQLERSGLVGRTVLVEAAERMTDGERVRRVRQHFELSPHAIAPTAVPPPHELHH